MCRDLPDYSNDPVVRGRPTHRFVGDPRVAAESGWEAIVASLVVLGVVTIVVGICIGAFLKLSFAIRREDRFRGALRGGASDHSARAARTLVGMSSSRWD
jgi:hypothetical protein